jgi:hypothetical protein
MISIAINRKQCVKMTLQGRSESKDSYSLTLFPQLHPQTPSGILKLGLSIFYSKVAINNFYVSWKEKVEETC